MHGFDRKKTILAVFLGLALGIFFTFSQGTVIMLGVITITAIALRIFLPRPDRRFLLRLFIVGISVRVILFAVFYMVTVLWGDNGEITPDSRLFFLRTLGIIRTWTGQLDLISPIMLETGVGENGYNYILAFFYMLLGYNPSIPNPLSMFSDKLINCLIGTISGIPIFYIAKDIFGEKIAKISSLFAVFYPSLIFWSMTNTREPINLLLVCLIIFAMVRLQKEKKITYLAILFISLLLLRTIRLYLFYPIFTLVIIFLLVIFRRIFKGAVPKLAILLILLLFILTTRGHIITILGKKIDATLMYLYNSNDSVVLQGGSVYKIYDEDIAANGRINKFKFFKGFAKGFLFFLLVPFPWRIYSILQLMSYPQIIIWYSLIPFIFMGIIFAIRYRFKMSLILICYLLLITSAYSLIEGNIGSAMRHRDLLTPFYLIFGSVGIIFFFNRRILFEQEK